jgi:hypothetical protein
MTEEGILTLTRTIQMEWPQAEFTKDRRDLWSKALEHIPDDAIQPIMARILKTHDFAPRPAAICEAYAELVHGPDDAVTQWECIRAGDLESANDLARDIAYYQRLTGPYGAIGSARPGDMAGLRKSFLDAYRANRSEARDTTRLGRDPRQRIEAPARVLALAGRIKSVED